MKANIVVLLYNKIKSMYIKRHEEKLLEEREQQEFLPSGEFEKLEAPRNIKMKNVKMHWRAPEFEIFERDQKWYLYVSFILVAIVAYAIFTNSLMMAITFILIGMMGYIYLKKDPRILDFMITSDGVVAGREIYVFENLKSFWVFYEEDDLRVISLHTKSYLAPYIHIPIDDQDPSEIRKILLDYLPEEEHKPGAIDTLDRVLRL